MEAGCPPYTRCTFRNHSIEIVVPNEAFFLCLRHVIQDKQNTVGGCVVLAGGRRAPPSVCGVLFLPPLVVCAECCVLFCFYLASGAVIVPYRTTVVPMVVLDEIRVYVDVSLGAPRPPARPPSCVLTFPRLVQESTQG